MSVEVEEEGDISLMMKPILQGMKARIQKKFYSWSLQILRLIIQIFGILILDVPIISLDTKMGYLILMGVSKVK